MANLDLDGRRGRVNANRPRELDRAVLVLQLKLNVVEPVPNDSPGVVPAVPRELVERLAEDARAEGVAHDRPSVVGDVELDVFLTPEPEADPRLGQLGREESRDPRAQNRAVLELQPLGDRKRRRRRCKQSGDDQRGSELLHPVDIKAGRAG